MSPHVVLKFLTTFFLKRKSINLLKKIFINTHGLNRMFVFFVFFFSDHFSGRIICGEIDCSILIIEMGLTFIGKITDLILNYQ